MPERYTIIDNETEERFNLGACNMADIKGAFRDITDINSGTYIFNKYLKMKKGQVIYTWEEFENTKAILDKITLPMIDY
jgi:hypothetical protein